MKKIVINIVTSLALIIWCSSLMAQTYSVGSNWSNYSGIDENGNAYWEITWEIQQHNGRYFLRDFGFWHYGYESNRTFDVSLDQNYLDYPTTSFKTYVDFGTPSEALHYTKN